MQNNLKITLLFIFIVMMKPVVAIEVFPEVDVINAGVNGNNTDDLLLRLKKDVLSKDPQLVILMIGTNDMLNVRNMLAVDHYEKNYKQLITEIKKYSELILMTIPPVNSDYILLRQDPEIYGKPGPQARVDSANAVIRKLAADNNCGLIDINGIMEACGGSGNDKGSLFRNEVNSGTTDGVHPNVNGYRVMGTAVYQAVHVLYPEIRNIVCFGDSITFGYLMKGQGTAGGDSYPAVLKRMMNAGK